MKIYNVIGKLILAIMLSCFTLLNAASAQIDVFTQSNKITEFSVPKTEKAPYYHYPIQISTFRACENKDNFKKCIQEKWQECPVSSTHLITTSGPELIGFNFKLTGNAFFSNTPDKADVFHHDIFEIRFKYRLEGENNWRMVSDKIPANYYTWAYQHPFYPNISIYQGNGEHKNYVPLNNLQLFYVSGAIEESYIQFCNVQAGVLELHEAEIYKTGPNPTL